MSTDYVASFAKEKNATSSSTSFPTSTSSSFIVKEENLVEILGNNNGINSLQDKHENENGNENGNENEDIDVIDQIEVNSINLTYCHHFYYYY